MELGKRILVGESIIGESTLVALYGIEGFKGSPIMPRAVILSKGFFQSALMGDQKKTVHENLIEIGRCVSSNVHTELNQIWLVITLFRLLYSTKQNSIWYQINRKTV